jgi:hypothetical protein
MTINFIDMKTTICTILTATFNNILVISLLSVLLVAETGVPAASHRQTLSRNVVSNIDDLHNFDANRKKKVRTY